MRQKGWYKVALALTLVLAVGAALWFSAPVRALTVDITDPSPTWLGTTISFDVTVSIEDTELLPIQGVDLEIYYSTDPARKATCADLPLTSGSKSYTDAQTGGGDVDIVATAESTWGRTYGYGYVSWEGYAYSFPHGYGYTYLPGTGTTSITYNVTWSSPAGWPAGEYKIETMITADGTTFTKTKSVTLRRAAGGGGGAAPRDIIPPRISDVTICDAVTETTVDICWTTHEKSDSQVEYWASEHMFSELDEEMVIDHDVRLTRLTPGTTYHYMTMSSDSAGNQAVSVEYTFTTLGAPPTFTVSDLEVTPAEIDIGEEVTISVLVTNTGDAAGTYEVTLKIDYVTVATEEVTLAGGASQRVIFTTPRDAAGTYVVNVHGLSGPLLVRSAAPPAPSPPTPTPPVLPPPAKPMNWWLIGGIIAGLVAMTVVIWLTVLRRRWA